MPFLWLDDSGCPYFDSMPSLCQVVFMWGVCVVGRSRRVARLTATTRATPMSPLSRHTRHRGDHHQHLKPGPSPTQSCVDNYDWLTRAAHDSDCKWVPHPNLLMCTDGYTLPSSWQHCFSVMLRVNINAYQMVCLTTNSCFHCFIYFNKTWMHLLTLMSILGTVLFI